VSYLIDSASWLGATSRVLERMTMQSRRRPGGDYVGHDESGGAKWSLLIMTRN
jgi:hypothetical protein